MPTAPPLALALVAAQIVSTVLEQMAAALIRNARGLGRDETAYTLLVTEEGTGFQFVLRQQTSLLLRRQAPSVLHEHPVVCRGQPPYGGVTLE